MARVVDGLVRAITPAMGNVILLTGIAFGVAIGSRAAGQYINTRYGTETKE